MQEQRLAFGPFVYDHGSGTLWEGDALAPIGGRATALLSALLEANGGVVSKADLMQRGWPDVVVEEGNLAVQIATLRKALGTRPDGEEWILTVPRIGYRLVREAAPAGGASGRPSIAVLPFSNLSSDPEQDYFVDGMVEDLIMALSRFRSFAVVARNTSFAYRGRTADARQVSRELGGRYLLEGSVRRDGTRVRVAVQLIEGATAAHLWADHLDGRLEEVFDFQDRVTENVVGLIEPQLRLAEIERSRRKRPENLDAYDLYLRALPLLQGVRLVRLEHFGEAIELLERAIALDPGFAQALAHAAWAHELRLTRGGTAPEGVDDAAAAVALAERALAADGNDAIVLALGGIILITVKADRERGLALIRRAATLNPNSLLVANVAGYAHFFCGNYDEAIAAHSRFLQLGPALPDAFWSLNGIARSHLAAGRPEEALVWGLRGLAASSGVDFGYCIVAAAYAHLGRPDEAGETLERALTIWPELTVASLLGPGGQPEGRDRMLVEGLLKAGMPAGGLALQNS